MLPDTEAECGVPVQGDVLTNKMPASAGDVRSAAPDDVEHASGTGP
jgi:hypothetical protein